MLGLAVMAVSVLYLWLLFWVTRGGWRLGVRADGPKSGKRYLGAAMGFLAVYLPVFWDWLPTVAMHRYHCAKDAGFWVYKTVDQWKAENPGVMETLGANKDSRSANERSGDGHSVTRRYILNRRFVWVVTQEDVRWPLPIIRTEQRVIDATNDEVLARYVDYGTGNTVIRTAWLPGPWRFWPQRRGCRDGEIYESKFRQFETEAEGMTTNGGRK